jgi:hypothetical protein
MEHITLPLTEAAEALEERRQEYERALERQRQLIPAHRIPLKEEAIECEQDQPTLLHVALASA